MPGLPGSPGLPVSPWQREGTRLARGWGGHTALPQPHSPGGSQPLCRPPPRWSPLPSPSHLLSLLASVARSALGEQRNGSGWSIPQNGHLRARGALTALPGGPPWPLSPGGPGTASTVAAPSRACGAGGHCPHDSPCGGDIPVGAWLWGPEHCRGAHSPRCPPHLRAVPCNEFHGSQLGRFQGRGRERGPGGPRHTAHLLSFGSPHAWIAFVSRDPLHQEATAEMRARPPAPGSCTPWLPAPTLGPRTPAHRSAHGSLLATIPLQDTRVKVRPRRKSRGCPDHRAMQLWGHGKVGGHIGVTHLFALDAGQRGEPRFTLPNALCGHTPSTHAAPPAQERGGLSPTYSPAAPAAAVPAPPQAPGWDPAAARRGRGRRRTGRSPPARAGRGHGSGGPWGLPAGRGAGVEGRTLTFSPFIPWMPGSPWGGNRGAGLGAASTGWAAAQHPPAPAGAEPAHPLGPTSPTLSPLGPTGPGLSWGGGNKAGALGMLGRDPALPSTPHARSQAPGFRLTETPSLPGTPGTPLGPGLPGSPVAPSTPSEMVGHTSHGSPCPRGQ